MVDVKAGQVLPLMEIISLMAFLTLLLAVSGVYGTVAFSVGQRTREFGIRMALGGTQHHILGSILVSGLRQIAIALSVGLLLALPAAFAFRHLLRGASVLDWSTYGVTALVLTISALCAFYVPARRALQIDPIVALRYE
jgi:ABC-type antimicrobial peptide transport system permease subunit